MYSSITELTQFGVIEINGEDAEEFLQAQLTSDVLQLRQQQWQFSAWCNPQGRIISNFIAIPSNNTYLFLLPADLAATVCRRLAMYVLRSKVTIINRSDEFNCYGIYGNADPLFEKYPTKKEKDLQIDLTVKANQRSIIIESGNSTPSLLQIVPSEMVSDNNLNWQLMDILEGIAWITEKTSELIIPQELEIDKLNAVSLNKGCFPGQEIIARIHYRGKVKYGLYLGEGMLTESMPLAGEKLYTENEGESCGTIINIIKDENKHLNILAVINHQHATQDTYYLDNDRELTINFTAASHKHHPGN